MMDTSPPPPPAAPAAPIHDLTSRHRRLPVEVLDAPVLDMLVALWSAFGGDDRSDAHELGGEWFTSFRSDVEQAVGGDHLASFGGDAGITWIAIAGLVATEADEHDPESVVRFLSGLPEGHIRRSVMAEKCWEADQEDVVAAVEGDAAAIERVFAACGVDDRPDMAAALSRMLTFPGNLGSTVAAVVETVYRQAFEHRAKDWLQGIVRSARSARVLATTLDPSELIDRVTNGIRYDLGFGLTRMVLVPSVTIRPWSLVTQTGSVLVLFYPVSDDQLLADPDAPPAWLVKVHKALGDERRMRMLGQIAAGPTTLSDLAETTGLAKSTVLHHIGILRSAGLIRVSVGHEEARTPVYTLRPEAVTESSRLLHEYLWASQPPVQGDQ